jgi:hypothetical protein
MLNHRNKSTYDDKFHTRDYLTLTSSNAPFLHPATPVEIFSRVDTLPTMQENMSDHRPCDNENSNNRVSSRTQAMKKVNEGA